MGTHSSKSLNDLKKNGDSCALIHDNISSYQGIKTETTESKKSQSVGSTSDKNEEKTIELQEIKLPTLFEWKEGGNMVYITGSFCGWSQFFIMSKQPNGSFQLTLDLPRGFHQYKFKVDNIWRYSNNSPVHNDNNNLNNFIDTTNTPIPIKDKDKPKEIPSLDKPKTKPSSKDFYSNYYPNKSELNTDAPLAPQHYVNLINLDNDTRQDTLGSPNMLNQSNATLIKENHSFKEITLPTHVNLNHILLNTFNGNKQKADSVYVSCISRLRNKFTTTIYYGADME